jgi:hypothetical protein
MADDKRRAEIEYLIACELDKPSVYMDGPTKASQRKAKAIMQILDRVHDARDGDRPLARRCGHVKPDVNCPACAADAFDALARVRDAEAELERLRAINAELVEAHNTLLVDAARSPQGEVGIPKVALDAAEQAVHACRHYALGHPSRRALYVDARDEAYDVLAAALPYLAARSPQSEDHE